MASIIVFLFTHTVAFLVGYFLGRAYEVGNAE